MKESNTLTNKIMKATISYTGGFIVKSETELKGRGITLINTGAYGFKYKMTEKAYEKISHLCEWENQEF